MHKEKEANTHRWMKGPSGRERSPPTGAFLPKFNLEGCSVVGAVYSRALKCLSLPGRLTLQHECFISLHKASSALVMFQDLKYRELTSGLLVKKMQSPFPWQCENAAALLQVVQILLGAFDVLMNDVHLVIDAIQLFYVVTKEYIRRRKNRLLGEKERRQCR